MRHVAIGFGLSTALIALLMAFAALKIWVQNNWGNEASDALIGILVFWAILGLIMTIISWSANDA